MRRRGCDGCNEGCDRKNEGNGSNKDCKRNRRKDGREDYYIKWDECKFWKNKIKGKKKKIIENFKDK